MQEKTRFVGKARCWRTRSHVFRSHRSWKTRLFSYDTWTVTERQTLDSSIECWWAPKASSTATRICRCIKTMPWNARRSLGGNATIYETDTSRTSTTSTTKSAIRRRWKLRLLCRSEKWLAVLQRATVNPAGSVFIFNFAVANFTMENELELMAAHIIWEMMVISVSGKEFQKIDGVCRQDTHSQYIAVQNGLFTSAERTHNALGWRIALSSLCAWKEFSHLVCSMSHPWLPHLPSTTSTSSFLIHSSFYDTRTRSTTSTTWSTPKTPCTSCTSPSSPSRQAAPSRISLAWLFFCSSFFNPFFQCFPKVSRIYRVFLRCFSFLFSNYFFELSLVSSCCFGFFRCFLSVISFVVSGLFPFFSSVFSTFFFFLKK